MVSIENIRMNEETGFYELECPYCHHIILLNGDEEPDYCEHVVYGHETVNWELIVSDENWIEAIKPALIAYATNFDSMEDYVIEQLEIDLYDEECEDFRYEEHIEECIDGFIKDGQCSAEMIRDALEASESGMDDTLVCDALIEVGDGNGTYYIFDSRDPKIKAEDLDYSYIRDDE